MPWYKSDALSANIHIKGTQMSIVIDDTQRLLSRGQDAAVVSKSELLSVITSSEKASPLERAAIKQVL